MNEINDSENENTIGQRLRTARLLIGLSQAQVAEKIGVSQTSIQHLESGRNQNSRHLVMLAEAVGVRPEWLMSGRHPMLKDAPDTPRPPSDKDFAVIPQFTARGASGAGYLNDHVEVTGGLAFKRTWLARENLKEGDLRVIYNSGNSNEPTLSDGEVLLIDVAKKEPRNGKMFAILTADGEVIIKRMISDLAGGWLVRSDNPDKSRYPDLAVSEESIAAIEIIGQVVWRGGRM